MQQTSNILTISTFVIALAIFSSPVIQAQWQEYGYHFNIEVSGPVPKLDRLSSVLINGTIKDESNDFGVQPHTYYIQVVNTSDPECSAVPEPPIIMISAGETAQFGVRAISSPKFNATKPILINLTIEMCVSSVGYTEIKPVSLVVIPNRYGVPALEVISDVTKMALPDQIVDFTLEVTNLASAYDDILITANSDSVKVSLSHTKIHLGPKETGEIKVMIVAPSDKFFYNHEQCLIEVTVKSANSPQLEDKKAVFVEVTGFSEKSYPYIALVAIALLLAVALAVKLVEKSQKEIAGACGIRPKKRAFTADERQRLEKLKSEKPELYDAFAKKQEAEHQQALARYNACIGMHKKKKTLLAKKAAQEKAILVQKRTEEKAIKNKEKEIAGKKRELEKKAAAIKKEEEKKAKKLQAAESKKQAELNKKKAAELKKRLEKKKKEVGKLALRKQKEAEKQKAKLLREIEKKKKQVAGKHGAEGGEAPKPPIQS